jgi:glycosyltransferase involved in cell wall biosynthesis
VRRVLLISNYGWTVFNFRKRLITELKGHGLDVFVQTEFDSYERRLGLAEDRLFPLEIDRKGINPWSDLATTVSILRTIRRIKPHVCLLFTIKPIVYGGIACRISGTRYVANVTGLGTAFLGARWLRYVAASLYKLGLANASHIFFQNETDLNLFALEGIVRRSLASILPGSGVDLSRFRIAPYPRRADVWFLLVGRMLRDKGLHEFVEAARIVKARVPGTRFQLLGPVDVVNRTAVSAKEIETWVNEGVIEYLGQADEVGPHIASADCVVLPSYREGTPRSLLEAAAMGRPVIATSSVGCVETVDDRVTGLLCRVRDASDLAAKMLEMISFGPARRAEMGLKGRNKVEQEFDEQIVIARYLEVIDVSQ